MGAISEDDYRRSIREAGEIAVQWVLKKQAAWEAQNYAYRDIREPYIASEREAVLAVAGRVAEEVVFGVRDPQLDAEMAGQTAEIHLRYARELVAQLRDKIDVIARDIRETSMMSPARVDDIMTPVITLAARFEMPSRRVRPWLLI